MIIKLNLSNHCIETEIKKLYNSSVSLYFKKGVDLEILEQRIELLKSALEKIDLAALRSKYPLLAGKSDENIELSTDESGKIEIRLMGLAVDY